MKFNNGGATICVAPPNRCHKSKILDGDFVGDNQNLWKFGRVEWGKVRFVGYFHILCLDFPLTDILYLF
jgi:hypothetical protein